MARQNVVVTRDLAMGFLGKLQRLVRLYIAGDDDYRIVGGVETSVKADGVVACELLHFMAPADHRLAVGAVEIQRSIDLLAQPCAWIIFDAPAAFFEDDVPLRPV